jgi:GTP-binding protein
MNNRNIELVEDAIRKNLDLSQAPTELPKPAMLVAIVGKRNAGKSTLVNSIAQIYEGEGDRVIVSEVPGTTRDSVDVRFEKEGKTLVVIDTAGVRKKRQMVTHDIEFYSYHRAQVSIRRADVVLMLIDATEPVSEPDKKLAMYIIDQHKPVIIVINKWDLARERLIEERTEAGGKPLRDEDVMAEYRTYLDAQLPHIDFAPLAFITAKDGRNVQSVVDLAQHIHAQANLRLGTGRLNAVVREILEERGPSTPSGRRARIYYATQTDVSPPTIVLFVNNPDFITEPYQRYMINRFREMLPFAEVPIKLVIRGRPERGAGPSLEEGNELGEDGKRKPKPQRPARPRKHVKHVKQVKRRAEPKPHPKRGHVSGPRRGQRPK